MALLALCDACVWPEGRSLDPPPPAQIDPEYLWGFSLESYPNRVVPYKFVKARQIGGS